MAKAYRFASLAFGLLALSASAHAQAGRNLGTVLAEIDQNFVCPQFQPDEAARHAELIAFSRALAGVGPTRVSYRQALYIRARMLERHNCAGGAAPISEAAVSGTPPVTPVATVPAN